MEIKRYDNRGEMEFKLLEDIKLDIPSTKDWENYKEVLGKCDVSVSNQILLVVGKSKSGVILKDDDNHLYLVADDTLKVGDIRVLMFNDDDEELINSRLIPIGFSIKEFEEFRKWFDESNGDMKSASGYDIKEFRGWFDEEVRVMDIKELTIEVMKDSCLKTKARNYKEVADKEKRNLKEKQAQEKANKDFQSWTNENRIHNKEWTISEKNIVSNNIIITLEKDIKEVGWDYYNLQQWLLIMDSSYFKDTYENVTYEKINTLLQKLLEKNDTLNAKIKFKEIGNIEVDCNGIRDTTITTTTISKAKIRRSRLPQLLRFIQRSSTNNPITKEQVEQFTKISEQLNNFLAKDKIVVNKDYWGDAKDDIKIPMNSELIIEKGKYFVNLTIFDTTKKMDWNLLKGAFYSGLRLYDKMSYVGYNESDTNSFVYLMNLMEIPKEVYLDKLKTERVFSCLSK